MRRRLLALVFVATLVVGGCGGGEPSPESVVRAWSESLNSGDNEAAADLFAPGAEVIQGRVRLTLETREQAVAFNASLPCSGAIRRLEREGDVVTATFLLGHRATSPCDGPGREATARFRVVDGKIVLWQQLPIEEPPADA